MYCLGCVPRTTSCPAAMFRRSTITADRWSLGHRLASGRVESNGTPHGDDCRYLLPRGSRRCSTARDGLELPPASTCLTAASSIRLVQGRACNRPKRRRRREPVSRTHSWAPERVVRGARERSRQFGKLSGDGRIAPKLGYDDARRTEGSVCRPDQGSVYELSRRDGRLGALKLGLASVGGYSLS
jgi:hypothetical protein